MNSLASSCLAFAIALGSACASTPLESVFVPNPNNDLKVVYAHDQPGVGTITEYVPANEELANWRHLLTIQFLEGDRRTPEVLVAALEKQAGQHGGTLEWAILDRDAHSVLYEWSLSDCPKQGAAYQDQCELARVLRGNDGLHRIAYTERARSMDAASRAHYLEAFRAATVIKGPEGTPVVVAP